MNERRFDRFARDLAVASSRRRFLGLAGAGAGGVALASLMGTTSRGASPALAQEPSPTPTAVALPSAKLSDGSCGIPFELEVRQGPSAGTRVGGILALTVADDGSATGVLRSGDGEIATVIGQVNGQAVALRFDLGGESVVFGTGLSVGQLAACAVTDMGGSAVGPNPGDLGDWRQARVNLSDLPEPICAVGLPCPTPRPERPEPTHPLPPDITSCDPLSVESCAEVCLASGLASGGAGCIGYCAEVLQC